MLQPEKKQVANMFYNSFTVNENILMFQDSSTFGQLYTLFDLDLSFNQLQKLGRGVFSGLASLRAIQVKIQINLNLKHYFYSFEDISFGNTVAIIAFHYSKFT
jgi:hypothetical protein